MFILLGAVSACTVTLTILCFVVLRERKKEPKAGFVQLPFFLALIGMIAAILFNAIAVLAYWDERTAISAVGFLLFVLLSYSLMLAYLNCTVRYDQTSFTARNFFGIVRTCRMSEVEGVRLGSDRYLYFNGHRLLLDVTSIGADAFLKTLEREYKRVNRNPLPVSYTYKRRWDPMNGHVDNPWFYFILFLLLFLFCLGLPVLIWSSLLGTTDPASLVAVETAFVSHDTEDGDLQLYVAAQEAPYYISYYRAYGDSLPAPDALCSGEVFSLLVKGNHICSLAASDGSVFFTPEQKDRVYWEENLLSGILLSVFCVFGAGFSILGILVGRNPDRYSKRVRRWFYKDYVIH